MTEVQTLDGMSFFPLNQKEPRDSKSIITGKPGISEMNCHITFATQQLKKIC
jgi:hypothetical protein